MDLQQEKEPLGLWDCITIIVGIVIGTTIFYLPWLVFANVPNPWMGLAVWVFGGFLALMGGLCYAELATTYPRSGGDYAYLTQGFSPGTGFLFGWAQLVVIAPASIGAMAYVFADIASQMQPLNQIVDIGMSSEFMYATLAVGVLTLLNIIGVIMGTLAQTILTIAKVAGLLAICVAGFFWASGAASDWSYPADSSQWGWKSLAIILVLYAYGGWNDAAFVAAEVRDRRRNIPLALMFGIGAITLIYVLINFAYIYGLGFHLAKEEPEKSSLPGLLLTNAWGDAGGTLINIIIMASALGAVNGLIFTYARIYATMGQDHGLFRFLGHWRPGRSPIVSLLLQALVTIGFIFFLGTQGGQATVNQALTSLQEGVNRALSVVDESWSFNLEFSREWKPRAAFGELVSHSAPAFWVFFLLTGFALFRLRDKYPGRERPFSVPLYPLVPMIFCAMCIYMLYESINYIKERVVFAVVLLLLGLPVYGLSRLLGTRAEAAHDPTGWQRSD